MIELKDITKTYSSAEKTVDVLQGASLGIGSGELVAVRGSSGCGKTTLLLIAGGLLRPSDGQVIVADTDPYSLSPNARCKWRASTLGFVFQQYHLVPYLSVLENVLTPSLAGESNGGGERAKALLEQFGLTDRAKHLPSELSTGQRQRTALARALLNEPKLILADEPTGNLDPENAEIVLNHLADFTKSGGSVLLVTHDADATARADRVVSLADGRIAPYKA